MTTFVADRKVCALNRVHPRLLVIIVSAAALLLLGTLLDNRSRSEERAASDLVTHTLTVLSRIEGVRAAFGEVTTAQRAYLLTEDESYLTEMSHSRTDVLNGIGELKTSTQDNPTQVERLAQLEAVAVKTLNRLEETVRIRREQGPEQSIEAVRADESRAGLHEARQILSDMAATEEFLLQQRQDVMWAKIRQTRKAFLLVVATGIIGLMIAYAATLLGRRTEAKARRDLAASESRLRLLVDAVTEYAIFGLDATGHVSSWNTGAERLNQYKAAEILGQHISVFYPPHSEAEWSTELSTAMETGRYETQAWRVRKDGSQFWAHVVLSPIRNEFGEVIGFAKVVQDLTEQRAAERNRMELLQASEAIRLRDTFLSVASHELRTPLTTLGLQLQQAQRKLLKKDEIRPDVLDRSVKQIHRLQRLIDDLLDLAGLQAGKMRMEREPVDLAQVAREVISDLAPSSPRHVITLASDEIPTVPGDRQRLEQVLTNLLQNAIKYSPAGGPIFVRIRSDSEWVQVQVEDKGIGIPLEDQPQVFGRFFRAHNASIGNYGGLGLGLFLSHEFVQRHGGRIELRSAPGQGTTFTVFIPTTDAAQPTPAVPASNAVQSSPPANP